MPNIEGGTSGIKLAVDPSQLAARVSLRSHEFRADDGNHIGGHYSLGLVTGATTGLAGGAAVLSFRWSNADRLALIHQIRAWANIQTAFSTAQEIALALHRVRNMANKDTGGTAVTLDNEFKKDTARMNDTVVNDIRVADTGAVTKVDTEDTYPLNVCSFPLANTLGLTAEQSLYDLSPGSEHPIVLQRNEGFRINSPVAQGATGVVLFRFHIDWVEVPVSQYLHI